jgi:polysaccharide pyruvyl transferase WcaK-like protein
MNISILDTTVASMNVGDDIIYNAIIKELSFILESSTYRKFPSRTIAFPLFQQLFDKNIHFIKQSKYIFLFGTNLLKTCMFHIINQWNINIFNYRPVKGTVLVGVGSEIGRVYLDFYTRFLYKNVLNRKIYHSVRDQQTKIILNKLGLNAINTGCPTLWQLSNSFCKSIPTKKSDNVVFTLHYGRKDFINDKKMINTLFKIYKNVYFFPQTPNDIEYLNTFKIEKQIITIPSNLNAYSKLLENTDIDYVGVRLHGGIYAMNKKKRTVIILVDERMRNIHKSNNLNCIERENIDNLSDLLTSDIITNVYLDYDSINNWKKQFLE